MTASETRSLWEAYLETVSDDVEALAADPSRRSLWVDVIDLYDFDDGLADALFQSPDDELETAAAVVRDRLTEPERVTVRVENHPALLGVADLRARHLGELVSVEGCVQRTRLRARLDSAQFRCRACDATASQSRRGLSGSDPPLCPACGSDAMTLEEEASTFVDSTIFHLEPPLTGADSERSIVAHIDDDLAGTVDAGAGAVVTGVLRPDPEVRSNVYDAVLSGVSIEDAATSRDQSVGGLDGLIDAHWSEEPG